MSLFEFSFKGNQKLYICAQTFNDAVNRVPSTFMVDFQSVNVLCQEVLIVNKE